MNYSQKLRSPKWQKKRLEIMDRDGWRCRDCGAENSTLHVHHCYYVVGVEPWDHPDDILTTLCDSCHIQRQGLEVAAHVALARVMRVWPVERLERSVWSFLEAANKEAEIGESYGPKYKEERQWRVTG